MFKYEHRNSTNPPTFLTSHLLTFYPILAPGFFLATDDSQRTTDYRVSDQNDQNVKRFPKMQINTSHCIKRVWPEMKLCLDFYSKPYILIDIFNNGEKMLKGLSRIFKQVPSKPFSKQKKDKQKLVFRDRCRQA